jgi:hypothetical protein
MARIRTADQSARTRLRPRPGAVDGRAPFREAIASLQSDQALEIQAEGSETMRGLKVNVSRAAKEVGVDVAYGETEEGSLLVWRRPESARRRRRSNP